MALANATAYLRKNISHASLFVFAFAISLSAHCQTDVSKSAAKWAQSVVAIEGKSADGKTVSIGSGFIVSADGKIATNLHVILGFDAIRVELASGAAYTDVTVIAYDEQKDLALLKVSATGLPRLDLGDSPQVRAGLPVLALGSPRGLKGTLTQGIVSALREHPAGGFLVIQTDAAVNPGNSGGPLINQKGQAIGVVVSKFKDSEGINFAIPVSYLRPLLESAVGNISITDLNRRLKTSTKTREPDTKKMPTRWRNIETGAIYSAREIEDMFLLEKVFSAEDQSFGEYARWEIRVSGNAIATTRKLGVVGFYGDGSPQLCEFVIYADLEITAIQPEKIEGRVARYQIDFSRNETQCKRTVNNYEEFKLVPALPEDQPRSTLAAERRKIISEYENQQRRASAQRCRELTDAYIAYCSSQPLPMCQVVQNDMAYYCRR